MLAARHHDCEYVQTVGRNTTSATCVRTSAWYRSRMYLLRQVKSLPVAYSPQTIFLSELAAACTLALLLRVLS